MDSFTGMAAEAVKQHSQSGMGEDRQTVALRFSFVRLTIDLVYQAGICAMFQRGSLFIRERLIDWLDVGGLLFTWINYPAEMGWDGFEVCV